jgi:hypothetical protein
MALRDQLNTSTRAELYTFVMQSDQTLTVLGITVAGDIPAELWYFAAGSMAVDNGTTVIKPTAIPVGNPGRYLRWIYESDWNTTVNKPTFATVATSGNYSDLSGTPSIPAAQVNSDWSSVNGVSQILNKPSIPAAQVQTDWNAVSGMGVLLNKPTLSTVATTGLFSSLLSKPTTLSGYGITDAYPLTGNPSGFLTSIPTPSFNNTPGRSIVSVANAANGFQVSSTREADIQYAVTIGTSVSLSGNSSGYVVMEVCSTNSSTPGDWIEVDRVSSGQSGTLVIGLVLNQTGGGHIGAVLQRGWYARLRSVNVSGTPTYTYNSGQEVLR